MTLSRSSHPMVDPTTGRPTLDEVWTLINRPAQHLAPAAEVIRRC